MLAPSSPIEDDARLAVLERYQVIETPPEAVFDDIVSLAKGICDTPIALVSLVERDRQWFKACIGLGITETPLDQSVCAHAVVQRSTLIIPDLTLDDRTRDNPLVIGEPWLRFYAGALLTSPEGAVLGTLCVIDDKPRPGGLTAPQTAAIEALARQVMALLNLRRGVDIRDDVLVAQQQSQRAIETRARASETLNQRLQAEGVRQQQAQEAGQIGTFDVDIATDTIRLSAESCKIFGVQEQELHKVSDLEMLVLAADAKLASNAEMRRDGSAISVAVYRIKRAGDGAVRWVERRGNFVYGADGEPRRFTGTHQDVTERKLAEQRQAALLKLGDDIRDATTTAAIIATASRALGETLRVARAGYAAVDAAADTFDVERDWTGSNVASITGQLALSKFKATIDRIRYGDTLAVANIRSAGWLESDLATYRDIGVQAQIVVPLLRSSELVGLMFAHSAEPRTWNQQELDFTYAVADRTYAGLAKVQAEAQQRLLNQELSHRLKNTLALVQAIAAQTLKHAADKEAVNGFRQRLLALSKAHDVLLQQSWSAARIKTLVASVLSLHVDSARLAIDGPDILLGPKAVLSLSLLLHELATNAVKHGSLSIERGRVTLTWWIDHAAPKPAVVLTWKETGGPPATKPAVEGMGSRIIRMGLAGTGESMLDYTSSGFIAEFRAPLALVTEN